MQVKEYHVKEALAKAKLPEKTSEWTQEELKQFAGTLRSISKPMIIAANKCDHPAAQENIKKLENDFPDYLIYPCSADSDLALRQAAKAGMIDYIPGEDHFEVKGELNEKQKDQLVRVKKAGEHLLSLIADVIDISKIETGQIEINNTSTNLNTLLDTLHSKYYQISKKKNIKQKSIV